MLAGLGLPMPSILFGLVTSDGADQCRGGRPSGRVVHHATPTPDLLHLLDTGADEASEAAWKGTRMSRRITGQRQLAVLEESLSERDLAVLRTVETLRLLDARQLETLHFSDHATPLAAARAARRVLERLTAQRLLIRLDRRIGGIRAGSASFVYGLGPVGERVLHPGEPRRRMLEPGERFLRHTLAVSQLAVDLTKASRTKGSDVLEITPEPTCWRRFLGSSGAVEILKPDLRLTIADTELEHHWFVEVDLATESSTAVVRKCRQYEAYWLAGTASNEDDPFPRVAWLVPTDRRLHLLRGAIHAARLTPALFTVDLLDSAVATLTGRIAK